MSDTSHVGNRLMLEFMALGGMHIREDLKLKACDFQDRSCVKNYRIRFGNDFINFFIGQSDLISSRNWFIRCITPATPLP